MKNPSYFLLMAGRSYDCHTGDGSWIACYKSKEEAESNVVRILQPKDTFQRGPRKGQVKPNQRDIYSYKIGEYTYDWYDVIDLRVWIFD